MSWLISQDGGRVGRLLSHGTVGLSRRQHAIWLPFLPPSPPRTSKILPSSSCTVSPFHKKSLPDLQLCRPGFPSDRANKYRSNTQVYLFTEKVFRLQETRSLTERDFNSSFSSHHKKVTSAWAQNPLPRRLLCSLRWLNDHPGCTHPPASLQEQKPGQEPPTVERALVRKANLSQETPGSVQKHFQGRSDYNKLHLFRVHDLIHLDEVLSQDSPEINGPHKISTPEAHPPPCNLEEEIDHALLSKLALVTTQNLKDTRKSQGFDHQDTWE